MRFTKHSADSVTVSFMTPKEAYAIIQQTLLSIVMETMTLEEIEADLREAGHIAEADGLDKFMQDIGLELRRAMDAPRPGDTTAGPKTVEINTLFTPVTAERLYEGFAPLLPLIQNERLQAALSGIIEDFRPAAQDYDKAYAVMLADSAPSGHPVPVKTPFIFP